MDGSARSSAAELEDEIRARVAEIADTLRTLQPAGGAHAEICRCALARAVSRIRTAAAAGGVPPDLLARLRELAETWPRIEALLAAQLPVKRRPLFPDPDDPMDPRAAQLRMTNAAAGALHGVLSRREQDPAAEAMGCFSDLSLAQSVFIANLQAALRVLLAQGRYRDKRFLDIGCGAGMKVLTAAQWFDRAVGVEIDPGHADSARRLLARLRRGNIEIIEGDALGFDGYAGFDVLYFFRPMRYPEQLALLEDRIVSRARPGALLIAPYDHFAHRAALLGCEPLGGHLYLAGADREDAAALVRMAETIGPAVDVAQDSLPEIWAPILDASRRRGYAP
ncbi:class I SAM-dependent methyltransferase [Tropicimonas sp. IMCC6043]|uniref:class I SAM-dependent methyltransferase n=1 Tax=Tropicimonas sp. IMCC6043 TaxID=2510645 RepID=UPI00101D752B|nr:class I SAM-dependent methyltransferase [Tropicimonas sp. IMCC6043]RYH09440.1 class I SAM-dependent methyltransferase [Tropicimonas sp. IMCC6043]